MGLLFRVFSVGAITVGIAVLAGVVWFAYQQGIQSGSEEVAPVISAIETPIKRKPGNPGGLNVPHQDKLVFDRLVPGQIEQRIERLLPPPEEPAERTKPATEPSVPERQVRKSMGMATRTHDGATVALNHKTVPDSRQAVVKATEPLNSNGAASKPLGASVPDDEAQRLKATAELPKASTSKTITKKPPKSDLAPKPAVVKTDIGWRVQLAAVSSEDRARAEWNRIKSRYSNVLGALDLNVQMAKLDQGTFYRVQAGPLRDRGAASELCAWLKSRGQGCLIVAP